jgi:hypothetical protein
VNLSALWASVYSNHAALRTAVTFAHVGGLLGGGGCAIAADRMTLVALRQDSATRATQLRALRNTHRVVLVGLSVVIASGVLLLAADLSTYLHAWLFWLKLTLVTLLLANGAVLLKAERQAEAGVPSGWTWLARGATASLILWFLTTLIGAALPNV